jgi:hypothetical protein
MANTCPPSSKAAFPENVFGWVFVCFTIEAGFYPDTEVWGLVGVVERGEFAGISVRKNNRIFRRNFLSLFWCVVVNFCIFSTSFSFFQIQNLFCKTLSLGTSIFCKVQ